MVITDPTQRGPQIEPADPETVQEILENAPEAAQANRERAEAILGKLEDEDVPEKYADEADWGFTFTGALALHPELFKNWWAEEGQIFGDGNLDRGLKEFLAAVITHERGGRNLHRVAYHQRRTRGRPAATICRRGEFR